MDLFLLSLIYKEIFLPGCIAQCETLSKLDVLFWGFVGFHQLHESHLFVDYKGEDFGSLSLYGGLRLL